MKKHTLSVLVLTLVAQVICAASVTKPADIPSYYASLDGKSGDNLWSAASTVTNKNFKSIGYNGLYNAYLKTDVYPADSVGRAGKIWDMYGECDFAAKNTCGNYSGVCDCYNREHSIPQSWWGGGTGGIGNDIFHVLPTDGKVNGVRSNYEYGVVSGGTNWVGNKYGAAGSWSTDRKTIASAAGESVSGSGNVFEPKPQYKGDWARGIMGTIIKWQQTNLTSGNKFFSGSYTKSSYYGLTKKAVVLLMKWHREDPVSQKEIDRNNGIQETQGNRNPFIDYPYLAEYIWGEHAGETIDMSKLMPSTDPEFIPGKSDGSREGSTPIVPGKQYTVTWLVNGSEIREEQVNENARISSLPSAPASCSDESNVFMGWSASPIAGTRDDAPAPLYTAVGELPAVTTDLTFYAVFAKEEQSGSGAPATYTYSKDSNIEGWTSNAEDKGNYWLLDQGKSITSPEIDLAGLSKITVNIRTYGGKECKNLDVYAAATDSKITTITTSNGSTMTEYSWNNNLNLAGTSALRFSTNYGSGKGIGFSSISIDATGHGTTYSRYITSCQDPTEVITVQTEAVAKKVLVGNQIYIIVGEQLFTIQGQRVK